MAVKKTVKKVKLPSKVSLTDDLGQEWSVGPDDELWEEALKLTENGTKEAVLPISVIISKRGWGWWSCFKSQDEWLRNIGIPVPNHKTMEDIAGASAVDLTPMLQRFGGYVAFLEAQVGLISGRRNALENAYKAAVMVHTSEIEEKGSEKSKEAQVLANNETIRQTKRLYIEADMLYETAKGMCEGYVRAYEATSRILSVRLAEMDLQGRRTA